MPSKSKAQQHLMAAAEHGADFPMAKQVRATMTHQQLHDFAVGSEKGKPEHVAASHPGRNLGAHLKSKSSVYHERLMRGAKRR